MINSNIRKILFLPLFVGVLFAIHGKITFFDGTYVVGKVTKVDESTVYIIPMGLESAEGVLVGNIDTLKLENGMFPVISSSVKYLYERGEFLANDDDWLDEYDDFKYDELIVQKKEFKYEESRKSATEYNSIFAFTAMPFGMRSLKSTISEVEVITPSLDPKDAPDTTIVKTENNTTLSLNFGIGYQAPYFPVSAVDISPGFKLMTYGFNSPEMGVVDAFQFIGNISIDFKPILYFIPEALHLCLDLGLNYNMAFKHEPSSFALKNVLYDGEPNYGGLGFNTGASIDYRFTELPLALRFFGNANIIPQGEPWPELKTGFFNIGAMLVVVMKRTR